MWPEDAERLAPFRYEISDVVLARYELATAEPFPDPTSSRTG